MLEILIENNRNSKLLSILVILSCLDVPFLCHIIENIAIVSMMIRSILITVYVILVLKHIFICKRLDISRTFICFNILIIIMFIQTLLNSGNWINMLQIMSRPYLIGIFFVYTKNISKTSEVFLIQMYKILLVCISIDMLSIISFPSGLYETAAYTKNWFLGYKTIRMNYIMPFLLLMFTKIYAKESAPKYKYLILTLLIVTFSFIAAGTASFVVVTLFAIGGIIISSEGSMKLLANKICKLFNPWLMIVGYGIITVDLILLREKSVLLKILCTVFNKSSTLSHRTIIWNENLQLFYKSPILGNGHLDLESYVELANYSMATSAHNMILTILVTTGLVGFIVFITMYLQSVSGLKCVDTNTLIILILYIIMLYIIGITSSAMVFSTFSLLPLLLIESEKSKYE